MTKRGPAAKRLPVTVGGENHQRETFAVLVAGGLNQQEAILEVRPHLTARAAKNLGWQWAKTMRNRIAELREAAARLADRTHGVSRLSLVAWHKSVLETPAGKLHENHALAQEVTITETTRMTNEGPVQTRRVKIKMPSKMDSARELTKILGYYAQPEADDPTEECLNKDGEKQRSAEEYSLADFFREYIRPGSPLDGYGEDEEADLITSETEEEPPYYSALSLTSEDETDETLDCDDS